VLSIHCNTFHPASMYNLQSRWTNKFHITDYVFTNVDLYLSFNFLGRRPSLGIVATPNPQLAFIFDSPMKYETLCIELMCHVVYDIVRGTHLSCDYISPYPRMNSSNSPLSSSDPNSSSTHSSSASSSSSVSLNCPRLYP
jgi:hypothetical protein